MLPIYCVVSITLGYKVFDPLIQNQKLTTIEEPFLYIDIKRANIVDKRTSVGFVSFAGSPISLVTHKSSPDVCRLYRETYADKISDTGLLKADLLLSSTSRVAGFVDGSSLSGNLLWKNEAGVSLGEIDAASALEF